MSIIELMFHVCICYVHFLLIDGLVGYLKFFFFFFWKSAKDGDRVKKSSISRPDQKEAPGTPSWSLIRVAEVQIFGPSSAFPNSHSQGWIRSWEVDAQIDTPYNTIWDASATVPAAAQCWPLLGYWLEVSSLCSHSRFSCCLFFT